MSKAKSAPAPSQRRTKILPCGCAHAYQDARYGRGRRVHNAAQITSDGGWRCTVCRREVGL